MPEALEAPTPFCELFINANVLPANNAPLWHDGSSRIWVEEALNRYQKCIVPEVVKGYFIGRVSALMIKLPSLKRKRILHNTNVTDIETSYRAFSGKPLKTDD